MKKKLILALTLLGLFATVNAQVCKISSTGDNVEVFSAIIENGNTVVVTVGNDSQDNSANVTVSVEVTYKKNNGTHKYNYTGKGIAKPNQETAIKIHVPETDEYGYKAHSVKVVEITGNKCQ